MALLNMETICISKLCFLVIVLCAVFVVLCFRHRFPTDEITMTEAKAVLEKYRKTILVWGPSKHAAHFGYGPIAFASRCHTTRCQLSNDMSRLGEADSVLFYVFGIRNSDVIPHNISIREVRGAPGYPIHNDSRQIFVFFHIEPPPKSRHIPFDHLNDYFNLTMTYLYHPDTDIVFRYFISGTGKLFSDTQLAKFVRAKTKLVAWVVSNCQTATSIRNRYVRSLSKYIPVDIYGHCGMPCNDTWMSMDCFRMIEKRYKFYLAFENSLCIDYVTEKATRTLGMYTVPILLSGADNRKLLPPHSYIDASNFRSPRHLANYLKRLASDDDKYMAYFDWKRRFRANKPINPFCRLCQILNNGQSKYKTNFNPGQYWNESALCKNTEYENRLLGSSVL